MTQPTCKTCGKRLCNRKISDGAICSLLSKDAAEELFCHGDCQQHALEADVMASVPEKKPPISDPCDCIEEECEDCKRKNMNDICMTCDDYRFICKESMKSPCPFYSTDKKHKHDWTPCPDCQATDNLSPSDHWHLMRHMSSGDGILYLTELLKKEYRKGYFEAMDRAVGLVKEVFSHPKPERKE